MKIAQVVHLFYPATGGIEHHVFHIARELAKKGNDVQVFTSLLEGTKKEEEMDGINIRRYWSLNFPLFSSVRFSPFLFCELLKADVDVYASHGYGSLMPLIASLAAFIKRKPFIFTLHGYPNLKGKKRVFQWFYKYFIASIFLRIAKKVIVVSKSSIPLIEKEVDKDKIVYIANGINEKEFLCKSFLEKNVISYIGRLDEDKGIDRLIKAFAFVKRQFPKLQLLICGKDEGIKSKLEGLANELKVEAIFTEVPYSRIKEIYCRSKMVVLPSRYEGFSLVWLEAMASGRPMFSTPVGDAPILFDQAYGKEKWKFLFRNEVELAERLKYFLVNEKQMKKTVEKAEYIVKEEYSWENVALITKKTYEESL
ncbi:glycosyltransferase family 4 protein [Candidatus Micrarchaeota archaeon]|nr:glycosyltransferase family 4 protein [Candidatus Micrarchaeota archaeon]